MQRVDGRRAILDAAAQIVIDRGAGNVTLDAVAIRAGMSKGGLLYHFATKQALLQAMVDRLCTDFESRTRAHVDEAGPLAAYVSVALDREANGSLASALLAAIANDAGLLEPMRAHRRRWLSHLQPTSPGFADRTIVWLATEGLWVLELLELSPLNRAQRGQIRTRLLELSASARKARRHNRPKG